MGQLSHTVKVMAPALVRYQAAHSNSKAQGSSAHDDRAHNSRAHDSSIHDDVVLTAADLMTAKHVIPEFMMAAHSTAVLTTTSLAAKPTLGTGQRSNHDEPTLL